MLEIIKCPYCKNKQAYEHADEFQLCEECGHYFSADLNITVRKIGPENCKCNPEDWRDSVIMPVCDDFQGNYNREDDCYNCYHPKECHR